MSSDIDCIEQHDEQSFPTPWRATILYFIMNNIKCEYVSTILDMGQRVQNCK